MSMLVLRIVDVGFGMASPGPRYASVARDSTEAFFASFTRVFFPAVISPKPWIVGIIMFVLDFLLGAGPALYRIVSYDYMRYRAPEILPIVGASVVGGLLGLLLVRLVMRFRPAPQISRR